MADDTVPKMDLMAVLRVDALSGDSCKARVRPKMETNNINMNRRI